MSEDKKIADKAVLDAVEVDRLLLPIMVAFIPRSGTTLLMSHLARDQRCLFDRTYPFEKHVLSYLAKISDTLERDDQEQQEPAITVTDLFSQRLDTVYLRSPRGKRDITISRDAVFKALWSTASQTSIEKIPEARYHAEKCPIWVPFFVRRNIPSLTLALFRDPRDTYLSQIAYNKKNPAANFGLKNATDMTRAWQLSAQFNSLFESTIEVEHEDSMLVLKYEEICQDTDNLLQLLESRIGWKAMEPLDTSPHAVHSTSSLAESKGRWKHEEISKRALYYLQILNFDALQKLGYDPVLSRDEAKSIEINFSELNQNSVAVEDGAIEKIADKGEIRIQSNHSSCRFSFAVDEKKRQRTMEVWLCVKGGTGSQCRLAWRKRGEKFAPERSHIAPFRTCDHYHVVRFRTCENPNWQQDFSELCIDGIFGDDKNEFQTRTEIRWIKLVPAPMT